MTDLTNYDKWLQQEREIDIDVEELSRRYCFNGGAACALSYALRAGLMTPAQHNDAMVKLLRYRLPGEDAK